MISPKRVVEQSALPSPFRQNYIINYYQLCFLSPFVGNFMANIVAIVMDSYRIMNEEKKIKEVHSSNYLTIDWK